HAETLMEKILANADGRFLYVPGNHDAYVAKNSDALREACLRLNGAEQKAERPPRLVQCGPVEFVALDAARPCLIWQSTGELTASAWANLDYILHRQLPEGCRARVLCSHFPLVNHRGERLSWRTRMLGDTRLENLLAANPVSAFLTGHVHYPFIHRVGGGSCASVGAGSITIHSSCAVIDIDARTGKAAPAILRF
ncbi:MAG: metallophosphoesterase, partial [Victivallales bacterium]|nr:metallophosphoesterase [Victivallales bacterium]